MKKIFFFLRHNNDIDHIVPVIYKWATTTDIQADVIICTEKSLLNDFRINLLKKFQNVAIRHITDISKKYNRIRVYNKTIESKAIKIIEDISEKLFKDVDNAVVVFDWTHTTFAKQMVKIAKRRGFKTVSLPHGDAPFVNQLFRSNYINYDCMKRFEVQKEYDYVVVPNNICSKRWEKFVSKDKLKIIGSARYDDEWMEILSKLIPNFEMNSKYQEKIILFLRNVGDQLYWKHMITTIRLIQQFPFTMVLKHHPRNKKAKKQTRQLLKFCPNIKISNEIPSSSLIKWADIVIDTGSSVIWEAVKMDKTILSLDYITGNRTVAGHYMPSSKMCCKDDLYGALEYLTEHGTKNFHSNKEREVFIKNVIDVPDNNVLERYCELLRGCLNG